MTASVRQLPRPVIALDAETASSYLTRLAAANSMTPAALWSHLRGADPTLPYKPAPEKATAGLEALGGLSAGWFTANRRKNLLPRRCQHHSWRYITSCEMCGRLPAAQSGCLRCSRGHLSKVHGIGPICTRHRVWHFDDASIPVGAAPEYLRAEHALRSRLFPLGVAAQTGELQLANRLLTVWIHDRPYSAVEQRRHAIPEARGLGDDHPFWVFPEAVALTEVLTDPGFTSYLVSPSWSAALQAELLIAAATGVVAESPPDALTELAARIVEHGNEGVRIAYGVVGTRARRHKATFERALAAAARSHRACLLRHLDAGRLPANTAADRVSYVSSSRVLTRSDSQPDPDIRSVPNFTLNPLARTRWTDDPITSLSAAPANIPRVAGEVVRTPPTGSTPRRAGERWTHLELAQLVDEVRNKQNLGEVAHAHQRTASSIGAACFRLLPPERRPRTRSRALDELARYLEERPNLPDETLVSSSGI